MELNGDGLIDIGDLSRIVDIVYDSRHIDCDTMRVIPKYDVTQFIVADTTVVVLDTDRTIKGLQLLLVGPTVSTPFARADSSVELIKDMKVIDYLLC